jgi:hypothetical protein
MFSNVKDAFVTRKTRETRETRVSKRMTTVQEAWIKPDAGFAVRVCKILDWSQTGVRLKLTTSEPIAGSFKLLLTRNGAGRPCRLKWRRGDEIGAEYI